MFACRLVGKNVRLYASRAQELKEAVSGTVKEMGKDAKSTAKAARETLQDDFQAVADSIARASNKIDEKVRGTEKERFHAAEEAGAKAEQEDQKFVFSDHAENPFNKAGKMMHEAKESAKDNIQNAKEAMKEGLSSAKEHTRENVAKMKEKITEKSPEQMSFDAAKRAQNASEGHSEKPNLTDKIENMAEKIGEKIKGGVESVKETLTGTKSSGLKDDLKYSNINPMGSQPNREPTLKPEGKMSKETEELQKKGAKCKAEEDSFNLM